MLKKKLFSRELVEVFFIIGLFISVGLINPAFLSIQNIMLSLNSSVIYTLVALGIAFVIITGEIDVSVGAVLGMTATLSGTLIRDGNTIGGLILALSFGSIIGLINGIGITIFKIPSIIMTLGTNGIVRGLIYVYTDGKWVENIPLEFKALSQNKIFGELTWFYFLTLVAIFFAHLLLTKTRHGRWFVAVGDNAGGATLLGISVKKTKTIAFVISSLFATLGGILYVSRVGFITPIAGSGYEMKVIAACVLGGISLSGGVGTVWGAAIGSIIMASISRILVFLGLPSDYDNTITGILLIAIVVSDSLLQKHAAEKIRIKRLSTKINRSNERQV